MRNSSRESLTDSFSLDRLLHQGTKYDDKSLPLTSSFPHLGFQLVLCPARYAPVLQSGQELHLEVLIRELILSQRLELHFDLKSDVDITRNMVHFAYQTR